MSNAPAPSLAAFAWRVLADVNRTVGGGFAAIELMRRAFTESGWLDDARHGLLVAVSRFTPGTNLLAYCAGVGWLTHGALGALVALLASSVPGAMVVALLSSVVERLLDVPIVRATLAVLTMVAAYLIASSAWALVRPSLGGPRRAWAVAIVLLALGAQWAGMPPVRVLLLAAVLGACTPTREPTA